MRSIKQRLTLLENAISSEPMAVIFVKDRPNPEQQTIIDQAIRTERRLFVFVAKGDTAWLAGVGVPPWESKEGNTHGNA